MSWTPNEYRNFIRGAKLKQADQNDFMARQAMANRYAQNAKNPKQNKIFDMEKSVRMIKSSQKGWQNAVKGPSGNRIKKIHEALKKYNPQFREKGGN